MAASNVIHQDNCCQTYAQLAQLDPVQKVDMHMTLHYPIQDSCLYDPLTIRNGDWEKEDGLLGMFCTYHVKILTTNNTSHHNSPRHLVWESLMQICFFFLNLKLLCPGIAAVAPLRLVHEGPAVAAVQQQPASRGAVDSE